MKLTLILHGSAFFAANSTLRMKSYIVLTLLLVSAFGFSQNQGALKGNVLDQEMQNEPLLFAHVQLKGCDLITETNFHGNFEFDNLESGEYTLFITYAGYENIEMPITVRPDEITQVNLGMAAKQISLEGIVGLELSSKQKESTLFSEQLPRK